MEDRCIVCGEIIPEGRQVCPICEKQSNVQKYFTPEEVRRMTAKEVRDNYSAITESMKKWRRKEQTMSREKLLINDVKSNTPDDMSNKWISVDERLPERNGRFLIYTKHIYGAGISIANYTPKYTWGEESLMGRAVWFRFDSEWGDCEIEGVTHWMPLPEAPKMKGGAE